MLVQVPLGAPGHLGRGSGVSTATLFLKGETASSLPCLWLSISLGCFPFQPSSLRFNILSPLVGTVVCSVAMGGMNVQVNFDPKLHALASDSQRMSLCGSDRAEGMNLPEGVEFLLSPRLFKSTQGVEVMGKLTASK